MIPDYRYEKRYGDFAWIVRGQLQFMTPEVSIAFDLLPDGSTIILKHGAPEKVEAWRQNIIAKMAKNDLGSLVQDLHIVTSRDWDVCELNRCLETQGYLGRYLTKQGTYRKIITGIVSENHPGIKSRCREIQNVEKSIKSPFSKPSSRNGTQ